MSVIVNVIWRIVIYLNNRCSSLYVVAERLNLLLRRTWVSEAYINWFFWRRNNFYYFALIRIYGCNRLIWIYATTRIWSICSTEIYILRCVHSYRSPFFYEYFLFWDRLILCDDISTIGRSNDATYMIWTHWPWQKSRIALSLGIAITIRTIMDFRWVEAEHAILLLLYNFYDRILCAEFQQ